jgi:tRNA nucleotidyltransferase/poly(A) polymerase
MNFEKFLKESTDLKSQWKKYIQTNPLLKAAVEVLEIISKAGGQAWVVGGAVRDVVLGKKPHDIDIATTLDIPDIEKLFSSYDIGKNKDFGIVVIKHKGFTFEVARLRGESGYSDGRRPDKVHFNVSLKDDMSRRDLTINAMAIDKDGNIIDHFEGMKAIKDKVVKAVGNPEERFGEDFLRMVRAPRFAAKLGFSLDPDTKAAIEKHKASLALLAPERIKDEIMKMASSEGATFASAIKMLDQVGILDIILPEVAKLKTTKETPAHHPEAYEDGGKGSVFDHVMKALEQNKVKDPLINLAVLFHDIGKPDSYKYEDGKHKYPGHAEQAKDIIDNLAKRLKLSNKEKDTIMFSAINHMKLFRGADMSPSKIMKLVNDENWPVLAAVSFCDDSCRGKMFDKATFDKIISDMEAISKKWSEKTAFNVVKVIDGRRAMQLTGLPAGKKLGDIIKKVTTYAIDHNISTPKEIDDLVMKFYEEINP